MELQEDRKHLKAVSNPGLAETPFRSPQLTLIDLGPHEWVLFWHAPEYASARRKRQRQEIVQLPLFDVQCRKKLLEEMGQTPLLNHIPFCILFPKHPMSKNHLINSANVRRFLARNRGNWRETEESTNHRLEKPLPIWGISMECGKYIARDLVRRPCRLDSV